MFEGKLVKKYVMNFSDVILIFDVYKRAKYDLTQKPSFIQLVYAKCLLSIYLDSSNSRETRNLNTHLIQTSCNICELPPYVIYSHL